MDDRTILAPPWLRHYYLGMAFWITYTVLGTFFSIPVLFAVDALSPGFSAGGGASLPEILAFQLVGIAEIPALMLTVLRRRLRLLVVVLLIPIAVTAFTFTLWWAADPEYRLLIADLGKRVLPLMWLGTVGAMAYAHHRVRLIMKHRAIGNNDS